jgi:hypothetical protein
MESETCRDCLEIQRQEEAYNAYGIEWSEEGQWYDENPCSEAGPWYDDMPAPEE